jgi:hypothetical protein
MANGTLAASQIEMLSQSGTGIVTITPPATNTNRALTLPDAAGQIAIYGTNVQTFDASGTWTKPATGSMACIRVWGGGCGGDRRTTTTTARGGGGGGYNEITVPLASLGSTVTVTVGAGGAGRTGSAGDGSAGGTTTFGALLGASGGLPDSSGTPGGMPLASDGTAPYALVSSQSGFWSGGQGYDSENARIYSVFGGGGGGGVLSSTVSNGGKSTFGGFGGAGSRTTPNNGLAPGGGGGGSNNSINGGDGAAGRVIVTVW